MFTILLFGALVAATATTPEPEPLKVYVRMDPGIVEAGPAQMRKDLADSVRDLEEQIGKRSDLAIVEERGKADILVTLLERRLEVNRAGVNDYGGELKQQHYQSRYVLVSRVEAGTFLHESDTVLAGAFVTWKRVAGVLAKDIETWSKHYRDDMLAGSEPRR